MGPTRAVRSPRPMALVAAMIRATGRVSQRATASPVSSAASAASPAAPAMARSRASRSVWSARPRPAPVNRTTALPTCWPRTMTGAVNCGSPAWVANPGETATSSLAGSTISTSAPVRAARSSTGDRSAPAQLLFRSQAAAAATATAAVSSLRCRPVSADTSAAANAAVSPASRAIAASATARKSSPSRSPIASPRTAAPGGGLSSSAIAGQPQPVPAAQDGLHDLGIARICLDLAAQVLHV